MYALTQAQQAPSVSTGVPIFDDLYGNLTGHEVIEISGCPRSGKSTLALNVVLHYLLNHVEAKATWIDTTGSFSVEHASLVLKSLISASEDDNTVLERLQVSQAFEVDDVYNVLEEEDETSSTSHIHFIVIDAITPLLGPNLSAASSQGHAVMVHLMRHLRERARTKRYTILVLNASSQAKDGNNHTNSVFSGTKRQPSLGPSFSFLTDSTLWLSIASYDPRRTPDECIVTTEVLHSKNTRSRTWSTFVIRNGIICNTDSPPSAKRLSLQA
ncbi:P-loop containing nucleoside triphosphate hydrolase protein [Amanita muscaria]